MIALYHRVEVQVYVEVDWIRSSGSIYHSTSSEASALVVHKDKKLETTYHTFLAMTMTKKRSIYMMVRCGTADPWNDPFHRLARTPWVVVHEFESNVSRI